MLKVLVLLAYLDLGVVRDRGLAVVGGNGDLKYTKSILLHRVGAAVPVVYYQYKRMSKCSHCVISY